LPTNTTIRIVQLIDSLEPGGAERMAVNLANAYAEKVFFSGIMATRQEGVLKTTINANVSYLYLNRTKKVDFKALSKGYRYLKTNRITHLQAHGNSLFFAVLLKLIKPSLQIIWHDHLGNRPNNNKGNFSIQLLSFFVSSVLVVNEDLEQWAKEYLWCKKIRRVANFTSIPQEDEITFLKGTDVKRIVCLANLKAPKNHFFILESFYESGIHHLGWTLHFVGRDFNDAYAQQLKDYIQEKELASKVYFYGSCADTHHILKQAQAGILGSTYEGFPVVLLEYGLAELAVIATDVGYNSHLIQMNETGWLIPSNEKATAVKAFVDLANNPKKSNTLARNLNTLVLAEFSKEKVVQELIEFIAN
jgi:glycosyltransferase involved in cell wall biosynthesis